MTLQNELNTLTSSLAEIAARLTALVEQESSSMDGDAYSELVSAERTVGALLRRLNRLATRVR
ncbi:MAG: hypothetical protein ACHQFZ_05825 [Acidimicrobiales bacterium]